ncbi:MAG: CDC48 family AAA ATPase [Methanofollis sp.]|uniref:CDC48 family AAA ATPase n=1 Tax=Methanofollis sp. TaxID=2052835 RepID=UPI002610421E|nr:CDC48 family AAA ATPase [Methanofollis sp.]MDD4254797.1 CDC48 family AAA ATPase [Methanofollis sp.]
MPEMYLKVDRAYPEDQGGGKARLDPDTMLQMRLSPGDLVEIIGKRRTVAKVWRAMVSDWQQGKIRVDKFTRENAGIAVGDRILVRKAEQEIEAQRVVLAPPEDMPRQVPINFQSVVNHLIDFPVIKNDTVPIQAGLPFMQPQIVAFKAVTVEPEEAIIITKNTKVEFSEKPVAGFDGVRRISYEDIGGLKDELQRVRETIELPMRHPELFRKLGIDPPKGVLLYGPPGTGKTLIAKAVASESGAHFISIAGPEVISKYYGESEQRLREVFEDARQNAPSIIFIDELDSIAPKREDVTGEVERRVVAQLLTMMDGLEERGQVVVIGATNRLDAIDPALRRPGRFDREIEIGGPNEHDRTEIFRIHTRGMPLADDVSITDLARQTHGFVGADLAALAREGAIRALRRYMPEIDLEEDEVPPEILEKMEVTTSDFREALRDVSPSAMREVLLEVPHITWNDVGGLESEKEEVREAVEYPLTSRDRFDDLGIQPPRGVLLYGPPGTGKTLIARAVASESGANFIPVRGPQLLSKWVGESERAVREIFKKARQVAPSIIFFDELDALAPARGGGAETHVVESVLNQILTEMDGLTGRGDVVVMGATNRPDIVDPALLRPGRFDRLVYIGAPDRKSRAKIMDIHTRTMPIEGSAMNEAVAATDGLDGAGIEDILASFTSGAPIGIDTFRDAAAKAQKGQGDPLGAGARRRMIVDLLGLRGITLEDPGRTALIDAIAGTTDGYVGSDLESLCREAGMFAMREKTGIVTKKHLETAAKKVHPTMNERLVDYYQRIRGFFKGGLPEKVQPPEYQ